MTHDPGATDAAGGGRYPAIRHDHGRRFWLELSGEVAYLAYRFVDERTVDYASTWTPPPLRGRGVATRLARHALAWAAEHGLSVIPSCWFVRKVMDEKR